MHERTQSIQHRSRSHFFWGLLFLGVGACLLAANLGFYIPHHLWRYWPFAVLALGVAQMAWPGRAKERLSGYWPIVTGAWGALSMYEVFGLHWSNSWPIFIIGLGLRILIGGIIRRSKPSNTPNNVTPPASEPTP